MTTVGTPDLKVSSIMQANAMNSVLIENTDLDSLQVWFHGGYVIHSDYIHCCSVSGDCFSLALEAQK